MVPIGAAAIGVEPMGAVAIGIAPGVVGATVVALWFTGPPTAGVPPIVGEALDMPVEERAAAAVVARSLRPVSQAASARAAAAAVPTIFQLILVPPRLKHRVTSATKRRGPTALQERNAFIKP
jgi:hypothetical protein